MTSFPNDVAVISWNTSEQVVGENTTIVPKATVMNYGSVTANFTVTCQIGSYLNTQTVSNLGFGQTQQVTFASYTPPLWSADQVIVTAVLAGDENPDNNVLNAAIICVNLDVPAVGSNLQTGEFVKFNLATPNIQDALPDSYQGTTFMAGGDWMNGKWMGVEYDDGSLTNDNYYEINPLTGEYLPSLGRIGANLNGIAYDKTHDILYGVSNHSLYQMNQETGAIGIGDELWYNLVGTPTYISELLGVMVDIAYDNENEILYGIDLGNDCLWIINPVTYEMDFVGYLGVNLNYAQDASFDNNNGQLYMAGFSVADYGILYWIDTTYGGAYQIGPIGDLGYQLVAFAIPYGSDLEAPVVAISEAGVLSWDPIDNADSYNVYIYDEPYGDYISVTNVNTPSYTASMDSDMKFYKVTAVTGRSVSNRPVMNYDQTFRQKETFKTNPVSRTSSGPAPR